MTHCARCGTSIDAEAIHYTEHADDGTTVYCSVNCIADVDHVDEERAQQRLFADASDP
jgi:recombinational DNA repair protein (RecF pathway)